VCLDVCTTTGIGRDAATSVSPWQRSCRRTVTTVPLVGCCSPGYGRSGFSFWRASYSDPKHLPDVERKDVPRIAEGVSSISLPFRGRGGRAGVVTPSLPTAALLLNQHRRYPGTLTATIVPLTAIPTATSTPGGTDTSTCNSNSGTS